GLSCIREACYRVRRQTAVVEASNNTWYVTGGRSDKQLGERGFEQKNHRRRAKERDGPSIVLPRCWRNLRVSRSPWVDRCGRGRNKSGHPIVPHDVCLYAFIAGQFVASCQVL
ncbi:unnamed protein product, partial [Ectocarpus sp. 12 AP-2014]